MPVTKDKARNRWVLRYTYNGKRYYGGRFKLRRDALKEEDRIQAKLKKLEKIDLDSYKLSYEKTGMRKFRFSDWFKRKWQRMNIIWKER